MGGCLSYPLISGPLLGERLQRVHWLGLLIGFIGLALVLMRALGDLPPAALIAAVIALTAFGVALINRPVISRVSAFQAFATQNANVSEC